MRHMIDITDAEFEQAQLAGDMTFCRRCGIVDNLAVAMTYDSLLYLDENVLPGAVGHFHMYRCPRCGHRALSEQHVESGGESNESG